MSKKVVAAPRVLSRPESLQAYRASVLIRAWCGLKTTSPCMWDDLDHMLEEFITDDAQARELVDAMMKFGPEAELTRRADESAWDLAEEIAIRIIGNRDLRFTTEGRTVAVTEVGPNKINSIKTVRQITGLGLKEAKDFVEGQPLHAVPTSDAEAINQQLTALGATVALSR